MLPDNIFIAIGAIAAAIIAGIFSYINLVSSKESKVSEFRQAWINSLREEISEYLSSVRVLIEKLKSENAGKYISTAIAMDAKNKHQERYNAILKSKTSILLRINDKEKESKLNEMNTNFLKAIESVHENFEKGNFSGSEEAMNQLINLSRNILKYEWDRARDGEVGYRNAKNVALGAIGVSLFLLALVVSAKLFYSPEEPKCVPTSKISSSSSSSSSSKNSQASSSKEA